MFGTGLQNIGATGQAAHNVRFPPIADISATQKGRPARDALLVLGLDRTAYAASALALLWIAAALFKISRILTNAVFSSVSSIAPSSRARRDEAASKI